MANFKDAETMKLYLRSQIRKEVYGEIIIKNENGEKRYIREKDWNKLEPVEPTESPNP